MTSWRVALLYNLGHAGIVEPEAPPDALARFDQPETVTMVRRALQEDGHEVVALEADHTLLDNIRTVNPDICFNMARGMHGRQRESQVPALLEMLDIPYTGSSPLPLMLAAEKAVTKRIWHDKGLQTAPFQIFDNDREPLSADIDAYPLFVKPVHEAAGMGLGSSAIVSDEEHLRRRIKWIIETYQQPALVEAYLPGREFSVGLLAADQRSVNQANRNDPERSCEALPILEILPSDSGCDAGTDSGWICPAPLSPQEQDAVERLAFAAHEAIGARDVARVDMRLDAAGHAHLMEIDLIPNLNWRGSRLVAMANAANLKYRDLVKRILQAALWRSGLSESQEYTTPAILRTSQFVDA